MNNNTNDDHGCYVVRLSRIFALPRAAAILILCLAVIYVAAVILSFVTDLIPEGTPHLGFVLGIALLISYLKTFHARKSQGRIACRILLSSHSQKGVRHTFGL